MKNNLLLNIYGRPSLLTNRLVHSNTRPRNKLMKVNNLKGYFYKSKLIYLKLNEVSFENSLSYLVCFNWLKINARI